MLTVCPSPNMREKRIWLNNEGYRAASVAPVNVFAVFRRARKGEWKVLPLADSSSNAGFAAKCHLKQVT